MFQLPDSAQGLLKIFETPEKGLDKAAEGVHRGLEKMKKNPNLGNLAAGVYEEFIKGVVEDFEDDLGTNKVNTQIAKEAAKAYWDENMAERITVETLRDPTKLEIDSFIADVENLPKLQEIMESHEPQAKWQTFLKGIFGKNPYLIEAVGMFSPTLKTFLSGILGTGVAEGAAKGVTGAAETQAEDEVAEEQVQEDIEREPVKPKSTLVLGDSINDIFKQAEYHDKIDVNGKVEEITKRSQNANWLWSQIKDKPDEYFRQFENAVVLIGTNDLGESTSGEEIWKRIDKIHQFLHEKGVRVYACTLPPGKGNTSGEWGSNFERVEEKRKLINKNIKESEYVHHVIDLAATEENGGLAQNDDPGTLPKDLRRNGPEDYVHPKGQKLAEIYNRELMEGANKTT